MSTNTMGAERRRVLLRVASVLLVLGVVATVGYGLTHPAREDPMDHARVFQEYAEDDRWVATHLVQFAGFLFVFGSVVLVSCSSNSRSGPVAVLGPAGVVLATASLAVSAVLQGVDGIALKAMVDAWASAPPGERAAAFAAAKGVRWIEIGVNSLFRLVQGATFVVFGAALTFEDGYPRWFGWVGAVSGAGLIARGLAVAATGFSPANPVYLWSEAFRVLLYLWLLALAVLVWRRAGR